MRNKYPKTLKRAALLLAAFASTQAASAQFRYTFKDTTTPYVALTGGTSLNGSTLWDDDQYTAAIPFTWKLDSSYTMTDVPVDLSFFGIISDLNATSLVSGFLGGFADFVDRGTTSSASPISYATSGTTPNRIFKLEFKNAGFYNDPANTDYVNIQMWIYETSNIVEYHFGASVVTASNDYFDNGGSPIMGMLHDVDIDNGTSGSVYYVRSTSSTTTTIDSVILPFTNAPSNGLTAWPSTGRVFRFTPRGQSCARPVSAFTSASQSALTVRYTFTGGTTGLDSLVWNFGDGQRQKVTSAYGTPITHTFTTAGKYTATVTAYNRCGNTVSSSTQISVAVADIPGLASVKVYPTIADQSLTIEGLTAGSTVTVMSLTGQQVAQFTTGSLKAQLNISSLAAGSYMLRMLDKNGAQGTTRFVKH